MSSFNYPVAKPFEKEGNVLEIDEDKLMPPHKAFPLTQPPQNEYGISTHVLEEVEDGPFMGKAFFLAYEDEDIDFAIAKSNGKILLFPFKKD